MTGRAEVVSADVARTLASVEARFPDLMPALPEGFPIAGPLTLTADAQSRLLMLSLFVIPGFVFAAGFYNWYRRR